MKRHAVLSRTFINGFDRASMLSTQSLSKAHRGRLRRIARGVLLAFGISLFSMENVSSTSIKEYVTHKEFALHLLNYDYDQFNCLDKLYTKESNWRPEAKNGSHHGIPQGRSQYLARVDGYKQVVWGIAYIDHRYSTPCNALDHWKAKGWH